VRSNRIVVRVRTIRRGGAVLAATLSLGAARTAYAQDDAPVQLKGWMAPMALSLMPEPGRVPLQVESPSARQVVGLVVGRYTVPARRGYRTVIRHSDFCTTPCQVFAHPGVMELYLSGPDVVTRTETIGVPLSGLRVRLNAPSLAAFSGGALLTTFGAIGAVAGIALGAVGLGTGNEGLATGGGITLAAGAALMVPGIAVLASMRWGIAWQGPPAFALTEAPRVAGGDVPVRGALVPVATLRF
jgi:hypothetical protein